MADDTKPAQGKCVASESASTAPEEPADGNTDDSARSDDEVTGTVVTTESHFVVEVAEPDSRRSAESMLTGALNAVTFGYLVVHYPERDVNLFMDGATAERVLAVFSGQSPKGVLEDTLVRGASSMRNMWVTFDIARPLAVSWLPGVPSDTSRRMTVEPPAEDASE